MVDAKGGEPFCDWTPKPVVTVLLIILALLVVPLVLLTGGGGGGGGGDDGRGDGGEPDETAITDTRECDPHDNTCSRSQKCTYVLGFTYMCQECPPNQAWRPQKVYGVTCQSDPLVGIHKIKSNTNEPNILTLKKGSFFGRLVASVGDLNGDGTADLAVGVPQVETSEPDSYTAGAVDIVFLNPDQTIKHEQEVVGESNDGVMLGGLVGPLMKGGGFGWALANIGDLDGDGVEDLVVGAINEDADGKDAAGALHVIFLMRQTGEGDDVVKKNMRLSSTTQGGGGGHGIPLKIGARLGASVGRVGDVNQDGVVDVVVATIPDRLAESEIDIYTLVLNADGTVKGTQWVHKTVGRAPSFAMAGIHDFDGDGFLDLAVGNPGDKTGEEANYHGSISILFLNIDGTVGRTQKIIGPVDGGLGELGDKVEFGSVANIGDLDGDGVTDLAVGALATRKTPPGKGRMTGAVHVLLLNRDGTVKGRKDITSALLVDEELVGGGLIAGGKFGSSIAVLGSQHQQEGGDKITRLIVGAYKASTPGMVYILEVPSGFVVDGRCGGV